MAVLRTRGILFSCLLVISFKGHSQDTLVPGLSLDITWDAVTTPMLITYTPLFNYIYHNPGRKDERNVKRYKRFINRNPNSKNNSKYFSLAYSLWELNRLAEAEKMFLAIVESRDTFYTSSWYHSSDVPGDSTTNIYGYGSFTSNYKNDAAIYLTKIYLEQKQFGKALKYLEDAVNKYPETYTCGTGYNAQRNEYDFLYASCYVGLGRDKDVLDLLLSQCLERNDGIIIKAIKNRYTQKEIEAYLSEAEASINCSADSFPSYYYQTTEISKGVERADSTEYYSGNATILIFGQRVDMPLPLLPEKGEQLTKEWFVKRYKESYFYTRLAGKKDDAEEVLTTNSIKE